MDAENGKMNDKSTGRRTVGDYSLWYRSGERILSARKYADNPLSIIYKSTQNAQKEPTNFLVQRVHNKIKKIQISKNLCN